MTLYIDGAAQAGMGKPGSILNTLLELYIGANDVNGVSSVDGLMDDVHFYNRTLSAQEIQDLSGAGDTSCP